MPINYIKKSSRAWESACGHYRIAAMGREGQFTYSASYRDDQGKYHGLGLFTGSDAQNNANEAKSACEVHQIEHGVKS
jgi:hypothetical protein